MRTLLLRLLEPLQETIRHRLQRRDEIALLGLRVHLHGHYTVHLEVIIVTRSIELGSQVVDEVRVCHAFKFGGFIEGLEGREDFLGAVHEVENVCRILARMRSIEP